MTREQLLSIAHAELGITESPANSNKTKYGKWYGLDGVKWCAIFVSWVYDRAGIPLGAVQTKNGIHHCQSAHNYYKSKNMITGAPQPGDIVLYDWKGDGYADHIGIFKKWVNNQKTSFEAYEGNTSVGNDSDGGKVMLRTRSVNLVKSFVNTGLFTEKATPPPALLQSGSRGSDVVKAQTYLFELGYKVEIDGWYGQQTQGFVTDFQKKNKMPETGNVDTVVMGALQEAAKDKKEIDQFIASGAYLTRGSKGFMVTEVQTALKKILKDDALAVNGIFDDKTFEAVKRFQKLKNLTADGIAGPKTFKALEL